MKGSLVARVLSSAWRQSPDPASFSLEELAEVSPLLLGSGAGSLGWHRVRNSPLGSSTLGLELQQAYRHHTLEAAIHERDIQAIFALLRSDGIEPVLVKGWSIARLYPEKGLRPYDDIDLAIPEDQFEAAEAIVREQKSSITTIDLHKGFQELDPRGEDDLFSDSQLVKLGDTDVRVSRPEDSLRVLCLHLLHHGAFRPLWLCDIALAVESRATDFDWDRCLGRNTRVADWVGCTIGLAHQLLGAEVEQSPVARRAKNLPRWLVPAVLKQWETPFALNHGPARHRAPMATYLRHPAGLYRDVRNRWPDPIEATISLGGPFNDWPRLPFQLGNCVARALRFLRRAPELLQEGKGQRAKG
ncbi:MAG: nucleotidyltransferase family protein [Acidobacteriota bacterium]